MSRNLFFLACTTGLLAMTLSAQAAVPPVPNIPENLMTGRLLNIHKKEIRNRVQWWRQKLLFANIDEEVISARNRLLDDYDLYKNPNCHYAFAEIAREELMDLLNGKDIGKDDPLRAIKTINVALGLARMHHNPIQPALEFMVADKNQAFRYIGWEGYRYTQNSLLREGTKYLKILAASLEKAIRNEKNPLVLNMVFNAMLLPPPGEGGLKKNMRKAAQKQFLQVLKASWNTLRKEVLAAKVPQSDWIVALRGGVMALGGIGNDLKNPPSAESEKDAEVSPDTRQSLQMIVDMAQSAAKTFDRAWKKKDTNKKLVAACSQLLQTCEDALNSITGSRRNHLNEAITAPLDKVGNRGAAMLGAILNWVDDLKEEGVKDPRPPK